MKRRTYQAAGERLGAAQAPEDIALRGLQKHAQELVRILLNSGNASRLTKLLWQLPIAWSCIASRYMMSWMPLLSILRGMRRCATT